MRPERFAGAHSLSLRILRALGIILLAVLVFRAAVACAAQSTARSSSGSSYDSQSFAQELARQASTLDSAGKSTDALRAYRESLPSSWSVDAGGRHYDVSTDLLVSRISKAEKQPELRTQQLEQARQYLNSLAEETASLSTQSPASTDSARSKLNAILARSEYSHVRQQSLWQKIRERINEMIYSALVRIFRRVGSPRSFGIVLFWIAICGAAILVAYSIFRLWVRAAKGEEMDLQAAALPSLSWQEWVFAARESAARSDYRMAIHCAYWAGIARLQDAGALSPDRAKTPREYLRALTKSRLLMPDALATRQSALSTLTSRLERTWYGYQIATEADFRDSLTQLEALGCQLT